MRRGWMLAAAAVVGLGLASTQAGAKEFYVEDSAPGVEKKCYVKAFVPAKVRVNTEGRLVRPAKKQWVVRKVGAVEQWELVTQPAVYVETREVVEQAHYTLRRVACGAPPEPAKKAPNCYETGGSRVICEPDWTRTRN
ncbi:hypothetical protein [Amorphus orientalis]|uniref:Uncharacterized protein n=1 Tax=Amorphus orientalis TaxID=649198 RepID=A0AAE3VRN0_9HYPH|nr:hypothetical protein [Amorphus orientalis]MDQ0316940.1 hypothetical protein [Amorphus orientalis]